MTRLHIAMATALLTTASATAAVAAYPNQYETNVQHQRAMAEKHRAMNESTEYSDRGTLRGGRYVSSQADNYCSNPGWLDNQDKQVWRSHNPSKELCFGYGDGAQYK